MDSAAEPVPVSLSEKPIPSPIDTTTPNLLTPDPSTTGHSAKKKKKRSKRNANNPTSPTTPTNEAISEAEDDDEDGPESPSLGPENDDASLPPTPMSASGILPLGEDNEPPVIPADDENRAADSSTEESVPQPKPEAEKVEDSSNHDNTEEPSDPMKEVTNDVFVSEDLVEPSLQNQQPPEKDSPEESTQIFNQEEMTDQSTLQGDGSASPEHDAKIDADVTATAETDQPGDIAVPIGAQGESTLHKESESGGTEPATQILPLTEPSQEGNDSEDQSQKKDSPSEENADLAEPMLSTEKMEEDTSASTEPRENASETVELAVSEEGTTVEPVVIEESKHDPEESTKGQNTSEVNTETTEDATSHETTKEEETSSEHEKTEILEVSEAVTNQAEDSIPVEGTGDEADVQEKAEESSGPIAEQNESSGVEPTSPDTGIAEPAEVDSVPATDIDSGEVEIKTSEEDSMEAVEDTVGSEKDHPETEEPEKVPELEDVLELKAADPEEPEKIVEHEVAEPEQAGESDEQGEPENVPEPAAIHEESDKNVEQEPSQAEKENIDESGVVSDHEEPEATVNTADANPEAEIEIEHESEATAAPSLDHPQPVEPTALEDSSELAVSENVDSEASVEKTPIIADESAAEESSADLPQEHHDHVEINQEIQDNTEPAGEEVKSEKLHDDVPAQDEPEADANTEENLTKLTPESTESDTRDEVTETSEEITNVAEVADPTEKLDETVPEVTETDKPTDGAETTDEAADSPETLNEAVPEVAESDKPEEVADVPAEAADSVEKSNEAVPKATESEQPEDGAGAAESENPDKTSETAEIIESAGRLDDVVPETVESQAPETEVAETAEEAADSPETLNEAVPEVTESDKPEDIADVPAEATESEQPEEEAGAAELEDPAKDTETAEEVAEVVMEVVDSAEKPDEAVLEAMESENLDSASETAEVIESAGQLDEVVSETVVSQAPETAVETGEEVADVAAEVADTAEKFDEQIPEDVESETPQNMDEAAEIVDVPTEALEKHVLETAESRAPERASEVDVEFVDTTDKSNEKLLETAELEPSTQDGGDITGNIDVAEEMGEQEPRSMETEAIDSETPIQGASETAEEAVEAPELDIPAQDESGIDVKESEQVPETVESGIPGKAVEPAEEIVNAAGEDGDTAETPGEQVLEALESQTAELEEVVAVEKVTETSDKLDEQLPSATEVEVPLDLECNNTARDGSDTLDDSQSEFKVSPLPASDNAENPVHLLPGEPIPDFISAQSLDTHVRLGQESYESSEPAVPVMPRKTEESLDISTDNTVDEVKISPLPAFENAENPIILLPGEPIPDVIGTQSLDTHVKLDQESYESSDPHVPAVPREIEETLDISTDNTVDEVKISPLPAFENAMNPISLEPGQPIPDGFNVASADKDVTLDKESYENTKPNVPLSWNEDKPADISIEQATHDVISDLSTKGTDLTDIAIEQQETALDESAKLKTDGISETPDTSAVTKQLSLSVEGFGIDDIIPVDDSSSEAHVALSLDQKVTEMVDESTASKAAGEEMITEPAPQSASSEIHGVLAPEAAIPDVLRKSIVSDGAPIVIVSPADVGPNDDATNPTVEIIEPTPSENTSGGIRKRNTGNPSQDRPTSSGSDIVSTRRHNRNIMNTFWHIFFFGWLGGVGRFFGGMFRSKRKEPKSSSATS